MFQVYHKCNSAMGNDNSGHLDEWPKPKKSRTESTSGRQETEECNRPSWECLPAVILDNVFQYLSFKDIVSASSTCHMWRASLYHPRSWQQVNFVIEPDRMSQVHYLRTMVGHLVTHATIKFNSMLPLCVAEFLLLLEYLTYNNNLQSLMLEPSHCHTETADVEMTNVGVDAAVNPILVSLRKICCDRPMTKLTLGCDEDLLQYVPQLLEMLAAHKADRVHTLGLASVKDDPTNYLIMNCDPYLLQPFTGLQILSLDYDILCDTLLESLRAAHRLERLVVHVHGIWEGHPGTSEQCWKNFKMDHPRCLLRLSLIHAYDEVPHLHDLILRNNMPLSHLRVLFCESMNKQALEQLVHYHETFVSVMWVDSLTNNSREDAGGGAYSLLADSTEGARDEPQNLILLAWLCKKLEEIVVIGYKYFEEDWIGVAKLRSNTLKKLEIASDDILHNNCKVVNQLITDIPRIMGDSWAPLKGYQLHPVLMDPTAGDSDEYLMPILLADLQ